MKPLWSLLLLAVCLYGAICLLVWLFQDRLVFLPDHALARDPAMLGYAHRDVWLETADGVRLHAWYLPPPGPPAPEGERAALVFCHGNAGDIADRLDSIPDLHAAGLAVLLFDYRGYGQSEGKPTEAGTYADAMAAYDWLANEAEPRPDRILVYGESLGGAVAIELAQRRRVDALAVESAFASLGRMGAEIYPWLPARLLARGRYDNAAKIGALACPLLLIHSPDDEIVPFTHGRALFEAATEPKEFLTTAGGHNDGGFRLEEAWRERVIAFLRRGARDRRDGE